MDHKSGCFLENDFLSYFSIKTMDVIQQAAQGIYYLHLQTSIPIGCVLFPDIQCCELFLQMKFRNGFRYS